MAEQTKTTRITFEKTLMAARQNYRRGHTYDVPEAEANEYVAKKYATPADVAPAEPEKTEAPTETAPEVTQAPKATKAKKPK